MHTQRFGFGKKGGTIFFLGLLCGGAAGRQGAAGGATNVSSCLACADPLGYVLICLVSCLIPNVHTRGTFNTTVLTTIQNHCTCVHNDFTASNQCKQ